MTNEPRLEYRGEQPYAAIRTQAALPFGGILPGMWAEVSAYLTGKGIAPSGAPFIRYLTTDMSKRLDLEVGLPVSNSGRVPGNERISTGILPAGRYALLLYTGPYDDLVSVTAGLLEWAKKKKIAWKTTWVEHVEWWGGRVEWYPIDPAAEPDPAKWQTELAFLTAGA
jgi:effector-binding domain-containing protein